MMVIVALVGYCKVVIAMVEIIFFCRSGICGYCRSTTGKHIMCCLGSAMVKVLVVVVVIFGCLR